MRVRLWSRQRLAPVTALLLLSVLWSFGPLRRDLLPEWGDEALPPLLRQAIPLAGAAILSLCLAVLRRRCWPGRSLAGTAVLAGVGLFVVPGVLVFFVGAVLPNWASAAVFALTPVFAVVLDPYLGRNSEGRDQELSLNGRALAGALGGAAGALCLLPVAIPTSLTSAAAFGGLVLAALSAAAGNCLLTRTTEASLPAFAALSSGSASLLLAGLGLALELPGRSPLLGFSLSMRDLIWLAGVELPSLGLLFWLLPRMRAPQMTTRYLWSLVFPVMLAAAFLRAPLGWRSWLGVGLMVLGAVTLLLGSEPGKPSQGLSLRLPGLDTN